MAEIKQGANVYTVMLVVSLLCLTLGSLFLFFESRQYNPDGPFETKVPQPLKAPAN
jgi:hypothetical protein